MKYYLGEIWGSYESDYEDFYIFCDMTPYSLAEGH
jgi:hypothetical protein